MFDIKPQLTDNIKDIPEEKLTELDETTIEQLEEYGFEEEPLKNDAIYEKTDIPVDKPFEIITASNVDIFRDKDEIDRILKDFKQDNWNDLTTEERKEAIYGLKDYIENTIGLEKCPELQFYNNPDPGDFAYVTGDGSVIAINEYTIGEAKEAADSIAHELWHAYQHQRANLLENEQDYMYKDGFDNYISPDIDFTMYEEQFVESDAREFAMRIRERIDLI